MTSLLFRKLVEHANHGRLGQGDHQGHNTTRKQENVEGDRGLVPQGMVAVGPALIESTRVITTLIC